MRKNNYVFWVLLLVMNRLIISVSTAQTVERATLTGQITNATDGQPLPFASVYINGSTKGTTTDETGRFSLPNVPFGANELVVSYTGFATVRQPIRLTQAKPPMVAVALFPASNQLADVVVKGKKDRTWLRQLDRFGRDLLGRSPFAGQCRITNPEVLEFSELSNAFTARASQPLMIENQALGYMVIYTLLSFRSEVSGQVVYGGTTLFRELTPDSPKQASQWKRNRQVAFRGSLRHLLASLAAGTHEREGFLVYKTDPSRLLITTPPPLLTDEVGRYLKAIDLKTLILPGTLPHERWLMSNSPLAVFYTRIASRESPYRDAPYAFSRLVFPRLSIGFTTSGQITAPQDFDAIGYLSNDRLAVALPDDWQHDQPVLATTTRPDSVLTQLITNTLRQTDAELDSLVARWQRQPVRAAPAVFLHLDKPLYLTGDRLWLSGYVLNPQSQQCDTALVGPALHAELWSAKNTLVQHQWLPVTAGRTAGSFRLSDTLATGTYWVRAYTDANREQGVAGFEKPLLVVNGRSTSSEETDDQTVGVSFQDQHPDNLLVEETPGAPYQTTLSADSTYLTIQLNAPKSFVRPAAFALAEVRGKLVQAARVAGGMASGTVRWSTLTWPSGTARLSLMDSTGRVWARRYVRIPDRSPPVSISANLRPNQPDSTGRRIMALHLQDGVGRPVEAFVSLAITNADQVPVDSLTNTFPMHLMALGGRRERYRITSTSPDMTLYGRVKTGEKHPVNVVFITNDQSGVAMRAAKTNADGQFQLVGVSLADTAQILVQVTNQRGKPVDAQVTFAPPANPFGTLTDWPASARLFTQWRSLIAAARQRQAANPAKYRQSDARQLREVVVKATRPVDNRPADVQLRSLHNQVDQTILVADRSDPFTNLYALIQATVPNIRVEEVDNDGRVAYSVKFPGATSILSAQIPPTSSFGSPPVKLAKVATMQNPLFLMDGFPINDTDGTALLAFSPFTIERVEVLRTGAVAAMYGASSSRGVIAFYTKVARDPARTKGLSRHTLRGYAVAEPFRSGTSAQRDVIAWEPLAVTDRQGVMSLPIDVPTAARRLRITLQGVTASGQAFSCTDVIMVDVPK